MTVTALLVSHDGERWLPAVLSGLRDQQLPATRVLAVDTGSADASTAILVEALGLDHVRQHRGSFPSAVHHVLSEVETEWVWLLHDDVTPAPDALAQLLRVAEEHAADIVGPKIREWPSLRRLLEVGVTVSGTAHRETGLERGEYDQGQHDAVRRVLAVNTAGMLVRRSVLEQLRLEEELPVIGADLDLGWRAARAGLRTVVAPDAVVFHAEAARSGQRALAVRPHRAEREAHMLVVLANSTGWLARWRWVRLLLGCLLRALGLLLARDPRAAADELGALAAVHGRPGRLRRMRAARKHLGPTPDGLLAPWWLPARHGLDLASDVVSAALTQRREVVDRRRGVDPDDEEIEEDSGLLVRLATSPWALGALALLVLFCWGARDAFGAVSGGALAPAPDSAGRWWQLLGEGWHQLGQGTDAPAPAYLLPLAVLGSVLAGSATAAVSALMLLSVPLAGWGAWRFAHHLAVAAAGGPPRRWPAAWAALTWAAVPLLSGAWGQGRFGIVATAALLPWLATASLGMLSGSADRRWRAGWRTGVLLAVVTAFTPGAWLVALLVVGTALLGVALVARSSLGQRSVWGPLVAVVATPPVLLLPGAVGMLRHDLGGLLLEAGVRMPAPDGVDLLLGRFPGPAAPSWLGVLLLLAAALALVPRRSRVAVTACWLLAAVNGGFALLASRVRVELPSGEVGVGLGFPFLVVQAALVTAVLLALLALTGEAAGGAAGTGRAAAVPGWRQPVALAGAAAGLLALVVPVLGIAWWLGGDDLLRDPPRSLVPAHMAQAAEEEPARGVLVVRGQRDTGLDWVVRRGAGPRLGEAEILALTTPDDDLTEAVSALLTAPTAEVLRELPAHGIEHVVLPAPADADVVAGLDAVSGLTRASTADRETPAWRLPGTPPVDAVDGDGPWWHPWLIAVQVVALLVVLVLCGPTRKEGR